jgi:hypothetical protein
VPGFAVHAKSAQLLEAVAESAEFITCALFSFSRLTLRRGTGRMTGPRHGIRQVVLKG